MSSVDLSRLTALVRTCNRPASVARLVASLRRRYPHLRLLVADDSRQPQPIDGADWVRLPADVGVSAARNTALARVRTPYFLLLEDDFEFTARTQIERLVELVAEKRLDVAAGDCVACRRKLLFFTSRTPASVHAHLTIDGDAIQLTPAPAAAVDGVVPCDAAHNFFVARTDRIRALGGWDPQLLVDERIEFFVRAHRAGLRTGVCPQVTVERRAAPSDARATSAGRDFRTLALAKMGASRLVDLDGRVTEAPPPPARLAA